MNKKLKQSIIYSIVSLVIIYGLCILFGNIDGRKESIILLSAQYLFWAVPASIIIGVVKYFIIDKKIK